MPAVLLKPLGLSYVIDCASERLAQLVRARFDRLSSGTVRATGASFLVSGSDAAGFLLQSGTGEWFAADEGELLYQLEKAVILDVQRAKPGLLFVHGATLELSGEVVLLVAPSGVGKSTTAWAMLERGFGFLGDELAPVELDRVRVIPYQQALNLKQLPPGRTRFPAGGTFTPRGYFLPANRLTETIPETPLPVRMIVFLERGDGLLRLEPLSPAQAATRLYPQVLNAMAHPEMGIDAVLRTVRATRSVYLSMGSVEQTVSAITGAFDRESVGM